MSGWMTRVTRCVRRLQARFYGLRGAAHRHFGNRLGDVSEYRRAMADFTCAAELDADYAQAYYNRGVLYWREFHDYERSVRDLTRAIEIGAPRPEAFFNRGLAHKLAGDLYQARVDFETYLAVGQDPYWLEAARRQLAEITADEGGADKSSLE